LFNFCIANHGAATVIGKREHLPLKRLHFTLDLLTHVTWTLYIQEKIANKKKIKESR